MEAIQKWNVELLPEKAQKIEELLAQPQFAQCKFNTYSDAMGLLAKVMEALGCQRVDSGGFKGSAFGISDKKGNELLMDFCILNANNVVAVGRNYAEQDVEKQVTRQRLGDGLGTKWVVRVIVCLEKSEVVFLPLYANEQNAVEIVRSVLNMLYEMTRKNESLELFFKPELSDLSYGGREICDGQS